MGAHALALGVPLITSNTREFVRIPGLRVKDWVAPDACERHAPTHLAPPLAGHLLPGYRATDAGRRDAIGTRGETWQSPPQYMCPGRARAGGQRHDLDR